MGVRHLKLTTDSDSCHPFPNRQAFPQTGMETCSRPLTRVRLLFLLHAIVLIFLAKPSLGSSTAVIASPLQEAQPTDDAIDFGRQIYPLLQQHCLECHSSAQADGDLRLDDERSARLGGHTGSPIFAETAEASEFFLRIISTEPGYRMPKRGETLDDETIELFRRWIEQGASYQTDHSTAAAKFSRPDPSADTGMPLSFFSTEWWGQQLLVWMNEMSKPRYQPLRWWAYLLGLWVFAAGLRLVGSIVFLQRRIRLRFGAQKKNSPSAFQKSTDLTTERVAHPLGGLKHCLRWSRLLAALANILVSGIIVFQWGWIAELSSAQQPISQTSPGRVQPPTVISLDRSNLTLPTDPMHPPRLGGVYYRGNDERDPSLFNGGFYRTAEMEVWLVDQQQHRIDWNDSLQDRELYIELTIKRSPGTTPQLFSPRVMSTIYLRRFRETKLVSDTGLDESIEIPLEIVEPDQTWVAKIPLEELVNWQDGKNSGVIYLFYGPQLINELKGRIHYGIRYELLVEEGSLSPSSTLWMGSMYDLGGRVLIPQEGEILLDHWFDFRPIPEIEGENPDVPELLGIPEHDF